MRFVKRFSFFIKLTRVDCIKGYRMVFASMRAVRLFLRARAVIKYVMRAPSTLKNADGKQRALRKFSRRNLDFSLMKSQQLAYSQFYLVGNDVKFRPVASRELQCGALEIKEIQRFLYRHCEHL